MEWFRLYDDLVYNAKAQSLPPILFKHWVNILCLASKNKESRGWLPSIERISFALRMRPERAKVVVQSLVSRGFLSELGQIHDWVSCQRESDNASLRKQTQRNRDIEANVTRQSRDKTASDTDTEQIQIQSRHRTEIEQNPAENRRVDEMSKLSPSALSDFDVFWAGSTKRGSKKDALAAWRQITFTERQSGVIEIGMAAWKQSAQWQDETKQPHICRWLKRRGWEELVPKGNRNGDGINEESKAEKRGRAIIEQTRRINQRILGQDSAGNGSDYDPREDSALYLGIDPAD